MVTLFGTRSPYTQPTSSVSATGQPAPEQILGAAVKATPPPAYTYDVTQKQDSLQLEQWLQYYNLPPVDNVTQTLGKRDSDRDGLADFKEGLLGTNPRLADTDGDDISDADEVLLYHTNPLDSNDPPRTSGNKLNMKKIGVRITGFSDNQLVADATPLIKGLAPAGELVEVVATNNDTKQNFVLGQAMANEGNVFILESSVILPDGDYAFRARLGRKSFNSSDIAAQVLNPGNNTDQTLNDSQPVMTKIRPKLDVNPPTPKNLRINHWKVKFLSKMHA